MSSCHPVAVAPEHSPPSDPPRARRRLPRPTLGGLIVGAALSIFTGRSWMWSASRQLLLAGAAAGVTYTIGHLIGSG